MNNQYSILGSFPVKECTVLELDRDFGYEGLHEVVIDGKSYRFFSNSIRKWIIIRASGDFTGKTASFF